MTKEKNLRIRNSTAEFLIFSKQAGENSIEVRVEDETVWLTQKLIAVLFEVTIPTVRKKGKGSALDTRHYHKINGLCAPVVSCQGLTPHTCPHTCRPGGAISLAVGMAYIFSNIGEGLQHTMKYWFQFIIMFEALFILTTIDAGTRVARYILQDILGNLYKPLKQTDWIPGIILTSGAVSFAWGYILYTGDVSTIWPMFGVTNQTLAALALAIGTTVILRIATKKLYALITAVPCAFMALTTFAAGFMNIELYLAKGMMLNTVLSIVIIGLVTVIIVDNVRVWITLLKTEKLVGMNDERGEIYCPRVSAHAPDDLPLA